MTNDELGISSKQIECCISVVDMVESTKTVAYIRVSHKIGKYYSIFINNLAAIGKKFGGLITKIEGDSLILCFPLTSNKNDRQAFKDVIECGITMLSAVKFINSKMSEESLPPVNYRISTDYGKIEMSKSFNSGTYDLVSPSINLCSEINRMAPLNGMVIGNSLYQITKFFQPPFLADYRYELAGEHLMSESRNAYPVYSIASRQQTRVERVGREQIMINDPNSTNKSKESGGLIRRSSRSGNILLVDDDSDILWTYKMLLEVDGYKVDAFSNSEDALKHFSKSDPSYYDLVLLDIRMPRLNGLQLFYRIKSIEVNTKIIFITALDAAEELLSILPGIKFDKHIIKKPIGTGPFLERINTAISEPLI